MANGIQKGSDKVQATARVVSRRSQRVHSTFGCHLYNTAIKHLFEFFTCDKLSQRSSIRVRFAQHSNQAFSRHVYFGQAFPAILHSSSERCITHCKIKRPAACLSILLWWVVRVLAMRKRLGSFVVCSTLCMLPATTLPELGGSPAAESSLTTVEDRREVFF